MYLFLLTSLRICEEIRKYIVRHSETFTHLIIKHTISGDICIYIYICMRKIDTPTNLNIRFTFIYSTNIQKSNRIQIKTHFLFAFFWLLENFTSFFCHFFFCFSQLFFFVVSFTNFPSFFLTILFFPFYSMYK